MNFTTSISKANKKGGCASSTHNNQKTKDMNLLEINVAHMSNLKELDFESWLLVQKAYRNDCWDEPIMECGMNMNSGYVYIALENGISIASSFGQGVDYIVTDFETGEEHFLDTYNEALDKLNEL